MKIMIVGDMHGNERFLRDIFVEAVQHRVDRIVQVGDFGYWPRVKEKEGVPTFLDQTTTLASRHSIPFLFLGGNHEDWYSIHNVIMLPQHPRTEEGFVEFRKNVFYIPNGLAWRWEDKIFSSVGGAYSIDQQWRTENWDWFKEEEMTYAEWIGARENILQFGGTADVLFSHDMPWDAKSHVIYDGYPKSNSNRISLMSYAEECNPGWHFHGHMHEFYMCKQKSRKTLTVGLGPDFDGLEGTYVIYDTVESGVNFASGYPDTFEAVE